MILIKKPRDKRPSRARVFYFENLVMRLERRTRTNNLIFIIAVLCFAVNLSCQKRPSKEVLSKENFEDSVAKITSSKNSVTIEDFDTFYRRFISDKSFQQSRISYPLKGKRFDDQHSNPDSLEYEWTLNDSIDYNTASIDRNVYRVDREVRNDSLVVEKIYMPNSGFIIETHFSRREGLWYMVFFSSIDK